MDWRKVLRYVVAASLMAGAGLKVWSLSAAAFRDTLLWRVTDGNTGLILGLAFLEAILGVAFLLCVWPRTVSIALLALLAVFSTILVVFQLLEPESGRACGCWGALKMAPGGGLWFAVAHNAVLGVSVFAVTSWKTEKKHASA